MPRARFRNVVQPILVLGLVLPGVLGTVQGADAITRSFSVVAAATFDFTGPGLGVQSPSAPCPAVAFGLAVGVPPVLYYQDARTITNAYTVDLQLPWLTSGPGQELLPAPCPLPGSGPDSPLHLSVPASNARGPHHGLSIDQLLCEQTPAADCFPDPGAAAATLARCPFANAVFQDPPNDDKGAFAGQAGSRSIDCSGGFADAFTYYDDGPVTPATNCQSWFFASGSWGTDLCTIPAEDIVPLGNGADETGYVVTCLQTTALVIDPGNPGGPSTSLLQSHDYILVLDLDGPPGNWATAPLNHAGGTPPLQGWHDLGGKNGHPCQEGPPKRREPHYCSIHRRIPAVPPLAGFNLPNNPEIEVLSCGGVDKCASDPAGADAVGALVVVVRCTVPGACIVHDVVKLAELKSVALGSDVAAQIYCGTNPIGTTALASVPKPSDITWGTKDLGGDYICQVRFQTAGAAAYDGRGACFDKPDKPDPP